MIRSLAHLPPVITAGLVLGLLIHAGPRAFGLALAIAAATTIAAACYAVARHEGARQ